MISYTRIIASTFALATITLGAGHKSLTVQSLGVNWAEDMKNAENRFHPGFLKALNECGRSFEYLDKVRILANCNGLPKKVTKPKYLANSRELDTKGMGLDTVIRNAMKKSFENAEGAKKKFARGFGKKVFDGEHNMTFCEVVCAIAFSHIDYAMSQKFVEGNEYPLREQIAAYALAYADEDSSVPHHRSEAELGKEIKRFRREVKQALKRLQQRNVLVLKSKLHTVQEEAEPYVPEPKTAKQLARERKQRLNLAQQQAGNDETPCDDCEFCSIM